MLRMPRISGKLLNLLLQKNSPVALELARTIGVVEKVPYLVDC